MARAGEIMSAPAGSDTFAYDVSEQQAGPVVVEEAPVIPAVAAESWVDRGYADVALTGPKAVADSDGPYLLDSGDRLRIFVYGQPNLSRTYIVDHAGQIPVPLIGTVNARGLTTNGLAGVIGSRLGAEFVRDPQVTVDILQNRPFFILGEVRSAGQYPYVSGMTVETAIAIAGGYSERASKRQYRITRRIDGVVEEIEAPSDYVVKPGDTVFVYERFF
ncbi:MAG: polysaccharide export protein [Alphaproteobacteria bacterium]|nr:polysaccharide export protein [Alphaproteobacteria bacterium]